MFDKAEKYLKKIQLKNRQRVINKKYKKEGLTDEILEKQVELNQLRHELDISETSKKIYDNYVQ